MFPGEYNTHLKAPVVLDLHGGLGWLMYHPGHHRAVSGKERFYFEELRQPGEAPLLRYSPVAGSHMVQLYMEMDGWYSAPCSHHVIVYRQFTAQD